MTPRVIPIQPLTPLPSTPRAPLRLEGPAERVRPLLGALEDAMGPSGRAWLRELRLADGEAYLGFAPGLPRQGLADAQRAFDTMRRLLPDTDILIGTAH